MVEGAGSSAASDRGYTSDSELYESASRHQHQQQHRASPELALRPVPDNGSWMLVGCGGQRRPSSLCGKHHGERALCTCFQVKLSIHRGKCGSAAETH